MTLTSFIIAVAMFGPSECGRPPVVSLPLPATLATQTDAWTYPKTGDCAVYVNRNSFWSLSRAQRCSLYVHEYGHLVGRQHADDPSDVMHAVVPILPLCRQVGRHVPSLRPVKAPLASFER